ncbi:hypothetical protein FAM09_24905 [Niastella caeni]|uniref:Uncharacterized protein n=1 Tax=Niastella caeni TaxID=2569763 RepID=A0A4S8HMV1_9BACT|nr:hypothetical protein [Niastella caeni]THU34262.1 hypothetical protein FAM09_24905 [Niastella caeni]
MSQIPALMQVPTTIEQIQETLALFKSELTIEQVNYDLVSIITLIGQKIKCPDCSQEERERYFSYMLLLQKIYRLVNDINDITCT